MAPLTSGAAAKRASRAPQAKASVRDTSLKSGEKAGRLTDREGPQLGYESHREANAPLAKEMHVGGHGQLPQRLRRGPTMEIDDVREILYRPHLALGAGAVLLELGPPAGDSKGPKGGGGGKAPAGSPGKSSSSESTWNMAPLPGAIGAIYLLFRANWERNQRRRAPSIFRDSISQRRCKRPPETGGGGRKGGIVHPKRMAIRQEGMAKH